MDPVIQHILRENAILLTLEVHDNEALVPWLAAVLEPVGLKVETSAAGKSHHSTAHLLIFASRNGEALVLEAERCGLLKPAQHPRFSSPPLQPLGTGTAALAACLAAAPPDRHRLAEALPPAVLQSEPHNAALAHLRHLITRALTPADIVMLTHQVLEDAVATVEDLAEVLGKSQAELLHLRAGTLPTAVGDAMHVLPVLEAAGIVEGMCALHVARHAKAAWWSLAAPANWLDMSAGVQTMREYMGDATGLYFAWIDFSLRWFLVPGLFAAALFLHRPSTMTVDTSPYVPLYSLLVVPLWGILFVRAWHQRSALHAAEWGSLPQLQDSARAHEAGASVRRPQFRGHVAISRITGLPSLVFPTYKRWLAYARSVAVTAAMMVGVMLLLVCFLNLEGYLHDPSSIFHVPWLYSLARPGAVFDPNQDNLILPLIPVVLHVGVILFVNQVVYSRVAEWLTEAENHETQQDYEFALAAKRFIFEACDCYLAMCYLAFGAQDILLLRSELVSVYYTDSLRRVLVEAGLPLAQMWLTLGRLPGICPRRKRGKSGMAEPGSPDTEAEDWSVQAQLGRGEYEGTFDDLLELAIQLGYITLFAAAFPLASLVSVATTWLEARSDAFKYAFALQRPIPRRQADMGVWESVLVAQAWLAVLSNVLLFGLSSDQLAVLVPEWFDHVGTHTRRGVTSHVYTFKAGEGRDAIAALWCIEHVVLAAALLLWLLVPAQPKAVQEAVARRHYVEALAARQREGGGVATPPPVDEVLLDGAGALAAHLQALRQEICDPVEELEKRPNGRVALDVSKPTHQH